MRYFLFIATFFLLLTPSLAPAQVYGDPNSLVDHWYRTYLGRAPDTGMATWVNDLNQGVPADQVLAAIIGSDEYYRRAGLTPVGYITRLFNDILNRAPSPADLDFWTARMYTEDRPTVAREILDQSPGVWVGSNPEVSEPVLVTPPVVVNPEFGWYRDGHRDWNQHYDIHEYRRPDVHYHANVPQAPHPPAHHH
jgi:hypothetical protein